MKALKSRVVAHTTQKANDDCPLFRRELFDSLAVPIIARVAAQVEKTKLRYEIVRFERFKRT
jgi:hypothetical protein